MDMVDIQALKKQWEVLKQQYGDVLPGDWSFDFSAADIESFFSLSSWLQLGQALLWGEVMSVAKTLVIIVLLGIVGAVLQAAGQSLGSNAALKTAEAAVLVPVFVLVMTAFSQSVQSAAESVEQMTAFMTAFMPVLIALLALSGAVASAALFPPLLLVMMNTSGVLIHDVILPCLLFSAVFSLIGFLSDHYRADRIAHLLQSVSVGVLSAFMAIFLAVLTMRTAAVSVADGLAVKTAKMAAGTFVPVVGRMIADAGDTASGAALVVQNTAGAFGMGLLFLTALIPVAKLLVLVLGFKVAAALLQPLGDADVAGLLESFGKTLSFMMAAVALVAFMYFLFMAAVVAAGNASYMMR